MKVLFLCPFDPLIFENKLHFVSKPTLIFGPWIINTINLLKNADGLELSVVAAYSNIKHDIDFIEEGIHFYFLSQRVPFLKRGYPHVVKHLSKYILLRQKVKKVIREVNPDIINLHGTEHDLACCMKYIKEIPKLITIQGFIHLALKYESRPGYFLKNKAGIEWQIFKKEKYFGIRGEYMKEIISGYNPNAVYFNFDYPSDISELLNKPVEERIVKYDLVFFARINKIKGIEDLLDALSILKSKNKIYSLQIIGPCEVDYLEFLNRKISNLGLNGNVLIKGIIPDRQLLFKKVSESKISVLPVYEDVIPGTIIEAIALGIPVITYRTGAIPDINLCKEGVLIVDRGNVFQLADAIDRLNKDTKLQEKLRKNSLEWLKIRLNNDKIKENILNIYKDILANN